MIQQGVWAINDIFEILENLLWACPIAHKPSEER